MASRSSLTERLPPEVLGMICTYTSTISIHDIKALRLVDRTFAALGAKALFREVIVTMFQESLDKVNNIMKNLHFRRYVRSVIYVSSRLNPRYENKDNWDVYHKTSQSSASEREVIDRKFTLYGELYRQCFTFHRSDSESELFQKLLRQLPWLETIILGEVDTIGITYSDLIIKKLSEKVGLNPEALFFQAAFMGVASIHHVAPYALIKASAQTGKPLNELHAVLPENLWTPNGFSEIKPYLGRALAQMRKCNIVLAFMEFGHGIVLTDGDELVNLSVFLAAAPNLVNLCIDIRQFSLGRNGYKKNKYSRLHDILRANRFPKLESLKLHGGAAAVEDIIGFAHKHKSTLKTIDLSRTKFLYTLVDDSEFYEADTDGDIYVYVDDSGSPIADKDRKIPPKEYVRHELTSIFGADAIILDSDDLVQSEH